MKPENYPAAQTVLAGIALIILGVLSGFLIFVPVPQGNQQLVTFAFGAISGALTVGGAQKVVSAFNTVSPNAGTEPASGGSNSQA